MGSQSMRITGSRRSPEDMEYETYETDATYDEMYDEGTKEKVKSKRLSVNGESKAERENWRRKLVLMFGLHIILLLILVLLQGASLITKSANLQNDAIKNATHNAEEEFRQNSTAANGFHWLASIGEVDKDG